MVRHSTESSEIVPKLVQKKPSQNLKKHPRKQIAKNWSENIVEEFNDWCQRIPMVSKDEDGILYQI